MYSIVNRLFHFSYFDLDYPTSGLTIPGLDRVYCVSVRTEVRNGNFPNIVQQLHRLIQLPRLIAVYSQDNLKQIVDKIQSFRPARNSEDSLLNNLCPFICVSVRTQQLDNHRMYFHKK
jgi:hypothetical protein